MKNHNHQFTEPMIVAVVRMIAAASAIMGAVIMVRIHLAKVAALMLDLVPVAVVAE